MGVELVLVSENQLMKILEAKRKREREAGGIRKLHNEGLYNLYSLSNTGGRNYCTQDAQYIHYLLIYLFYSNTVKL
jgi:hypothetical protein